MILYIVMILAACAMIWANQQFKTKGVTWGRPLAGVCGVVALLCAIASIVFTSTGVGNASEHEEIRQKALKYDSIAFKKFAEYLVAKHADSKAVVILPAFGTAEREIERKNATIDVFMNTIRNGGIEVVMEEVYDPVAAMAEQLREQGIEAPTGEEMDMEMYGEAEITVKYIEGVLASVPGEYNMIISLAGFPYDAGEISIFKEEDEDAKKKIALHNAPINMFKPAIKSGWIVCSLQHKPGVKWNYKEPIPEDEQEAFDQRFMLVTPENVDQIDKDYKNFFYKPK